MRAWMLCALLAAGCARSIEDLSPISCAQNGLCPSPYVCVHDQCLASTPCNASEPGGCPADRPRCTLLRTDDAKFAAQCVPQDGSTAAGGACQMLASVYEVTNDSGEFPWADRTCAARTMCYDFQLGQPLTASLPGTCRSFCARDADCTGGQRCLDAVGARYLAGYTGPAVGVCMPTCALFTSGACTGGLECAVGLDIDGASAFGLCMPPGDPTVGDPCTLKFRCSSGLACVPKGTALNCRKLCKPGGTPGCTAPETCDTSVVQMTGAGVCR